MKKAAQRTLGAGVVAGAMFAVWRAYKARMPAPSSTTEWEAAPFPFPPIPRPAAPPRPVTAPAHVSTGPGGSTEPGSVEPVDGECPATHPVKGKLASGIYHVPGGLNYTRTRPDRCYVDATAAEADGLRAAKR